MPSEAELVAQRRLTAEFIAANPTTVVLVPQTRQLDDEGYVEDAGTPRAAQVGRLIPQGPPRLSETEQGTLRLIEYYLLLPWDGVVAAGDRFTYAGDECEVLEIKHPNGYEQRARVLRRLPRPTSAVTP